jgi:hypothetical protein
VTRTNINFVVLAVFVAVLCALCYIGKPVIAHKYTTGMLTFIERFRSSSIGEKIIDHYYRRIAEDVFGGIGAGRDIATMTPESVKRMYFLLTDRLFTALLALVGFVGSVLLFFVNIGQKHPTASRTKIIVNIIMVVIAGTILRIVLAGITYGNFDMQSYHMVANALKKGMNVYAATDRYNYSPVWFTILYALKCIEPSDAWFYLLVKLFLCCVDLLTLAVALSIARIRKLPLVATAIFFYLNPISFLMTGYHGQFENFAMLMVVTGIYMYLRFSTRPVLGSTLLWLFATSGMIIKHNTFYELIICLHTAIKRYWVKLSLFIVSVLIFLLLFVPYWKTGSKGIIEHVFKYGSFSGGYGLTSLVMVSQLKYLFVVGLFLFPLILKGKDIIARCLLGTLFFLTFTTGFAAQYFVLPLVLGALRPSKFFLLYTVIVSLLVLGNVNNVFVPGLHLLKLNIGWVAVICWFIAEMWANRRIPDSEISASEQVKKST